MEVTCNTCGKAFNRKPSQVKDRNFCSKECWLIYDKENGRDYRKTGEYRNCKNCDKEFYVRRNQIDKGNGLYCSVECKNESLKNYIECPVCGNTFWNKGNVSKRKYCSRECSGKARKNGKEVECVNCGEIIYRTKERLDKNDYNCCSVECLNEYQGRNKIEFICKICNKKFYWSKSRVKDNNPTYCSEECRFKDKERLTEIAVNANLKIQKMKEPTSIEIMGRKILEDLGIDFKEQVVICDKFIVDVFVSDYNLIIQWDGDYWHCHPKYKNPDDRQVRRKKIDESQNAYFKKCGYNLLRFWGSEIREEYDGNSEYIRRKISEITRRAKGVV